LELLAFVPLDPLAKILSADGHPLSVRQKRSDLVEGVPLSPELKNVSGMVIQPRPSPLGLLFPAELVDIVHRVFAPFTSDARSITDTSPVITRRYPAFTFAAPGIHAETPSR
jgi:hypothetical protein